MRILLFFLFLLPSFAYAATPPSEILVKWNGSKKHFEYTCSDPMNYSLIADMFGLEPHDLIAINTGTMQTLLDRGDKVLVPLNHKNYFTDLTLTSENKVEPVWHALDKETAREEILQLFHLDKVQFALWNVEQKDRYAANEKVIVGWVLYQPIAPLVREEEGLPVKEGSLDPKLAGSDILRSSPKSNGKAGSAPKINPAVKTPIKPTASPKTTTSAKATAKVSESTAQESNALSKIREGLQKAGKETGSFIQNLFGAGSSDEKSRKNKDTTEKGLSTRERWIAQLRQRKDSIRRASEQASLTPSGATTSHSKRVLPRKEEEVVLRSSRKGILGSKRKGIEQADSISVGKDSLILSSVPTPAKAPPAPPMPRFPEQFKGRKTKKVTGGVVTPSVAEVDVEKKREEVTPLEIKTSEIKITDEPSQVIREPLTHTVRGKAGIFYAGASEGKIYVVTNLCARGSVVQITNTSNGRTILADVIGQLPAADANKGLVLKVSDNCKSYLKLTHDSFPVQVDY